MAAMMSRQLQAEGISSRRPFQYLGANKPHPEGMFLGIDGALASAGGGGGMYDVAAEKMEVEVASLMDASNLVVDVVVLKVVVVGALDEIGERDPENVELDDLDVLESLQVPTRFGSCRTSLTTPFGGFLGREPALLSESETPTKM
jgi:hypothetical protein